MAAVRSVVSSSAKLSRTLVWGRWMISTAVAAPTTSPPSSPHPTPFLPPPPPPHVASLSIRPRNLKAALRDQNPTAIRSILMAVKSVPEPLPVTFYNALLAACAKEGNAQVARDVYILMRVQGVLPNATSHTRFSRALCRSGHLAEALEHVEALAGQGGTSCSAFNAILNACGRAKSQQLADRCLAAMHRQGVVPTAQTHAEVMKLAGAVGDVAGVYRSWRQLARLEEQPSLLACSGYVLALASCQDLTGAVRALEELGQAAIREAGRMSGDGELAAEAPGGSTSIADSGSSGGGGGWWAHPSAALLSGRAREEVVRAYNQVLNVAGGRGEADTAARLVAQMQRGGVAMDSYSYNAWMRAAAKQGQVETVLRVWCHMSRAGVPPTRHTHEARLLALCKGGRVEEAQEALQGMGAEASAHGFNGVMQAWADEGESSRAFATYRAMKREGLRPDRCTFLALLAASAGPRAVGLTPGLWAEEEVATRIESVEAEMAREGLQHDSKTTTAVIQAYGREGMVGAMIGRLRGWQGMGLLGEAAYNAAISACGKHQQMEVAQELIQEMATDGVEPSLVTFNAVINGCSYGGEVGMAMEVMEELRGRGLRADACTHNSLIKVACHCGDMDMALEAMGDMEGSGVRADEQTYETLMAGAGHNKRMDVMEYVVEHMRRGGAPPTSFVCAELVGGYVEMGQVEEAVAALRVLGHRMDQSEGQNLSGNLRAMRKGERRIEGVVGGDVESEDGDGGDGKEGNDGGELWKILENVTEGGGEVGLGRYLMRVGEGLDNDVAEGSCEESGWAVRLKSNYDKR